MDKLYSVSVVVSECCASEETRGELFFVGIFDEEHVRDGVRNYIYKKEKEHISKNVSDDCVISRINEEVDATTMEEILNNPQFLIDIDGRCYGFCINNAECNTMNDTKVLHYYF